MQFPEREAALAWVGRTLIDRDGAEIGSCTAVFTDDATQLTEWVCSDIEGSMVFIPAVGAAESGHQVQVAVSRTDVAGAPQVGGGDHLSDEEEAALYRHYGIPYSRDASASLLPTEEPPPATEQAAPDAATAEQVQASAAEGPGTEPEPEPEPVGPAAVAEPTGSEPVTGPVVADAAAAGQEPDDTRPPAGRRRVLPAVGALAGAGVALGVALGVRRLRRRRPPTRTERLLARGRAVADAVGARTGRVTASGRVSASARRGRTGAAAGGIPALAALALAAARRRRGRR